MLRILRIFLLVFSLQELKVTAQKLMAWEQAYRAMFSNREAGILSVMPLCFSGNGSAASTPSKKGPSNESDQDTDSRSLLRVAVFLQLLQVSDVNEKHETVSLTIAENTNWVDCRLGWSPEQSPAREITLLPSRFRQMEVFRPLIRILQETNPQPNAAAETDIFISRTGRVHLSREFETVISCNIHVLMYPFDIQQCFITIESPLPLRLINLTHQRGLNVSVESSILLANGRYRPSNSWMVTLLPPIRVPRSCDSNGNGKCSREGLQYRLLLRRHPYYQLITLMFPATLVVIISSCVFILPPGSGNKTELSVTILLSLFMFAQLMYESMPDTGSTLPLLSMFFLSGIMLVGVSCIISIFTTVLSSTSKHVAIPAPLLWCVRVLGPCLMADLAISKQLKRVRNGKKDRSRDKEESQRLGQLLESEVEGGKLTNMAVSTDAQHGDGVSWILVGALVDRCFFVVHLSTCIVTLVAFATFGYVPWNCYGNLPLEPEDWLHVCAQLRIQGDVHVGSICNEHE